MSILPDHILSKIADPAERKRMGKAGLTLPEHIAAYSAKLERTLHNQYSDFLRRNGFKDHQIIHANPNKKSTLPIGYPDFTVLRDGKVLFIEFKVGTNVCSPDQETVIADLIGQGFTVLVLYSYSEAINETMKYFGL